MDISAVATADDKPSEFIEGLAECIPEESNLDSPLGVLKMGFGVAVCGPSAVPKDPSGTGEIVAEGAKLLPEATLGKVADFALQIGESFGVGLMTIPGVAVTVGIIVIITCLVQMVFMHVRAALLPLAAAASGTSKGREVFVQV